MATDPEIFKHKEWLGLLQPVGLVVSPPALIKAQVVVDRSQTIELQARLQSVTASIALSDESGSERLCVQSFLELAEQVLGWLPEDIAGVLDRESLPESLEVVLPDYGETLKPTYAVHDPDGDGWLLLVQEVKTAQALDEVDVEVEKGHGWKASVQEKFERLLRETAIPIGILCNGVSVRLVYAPKGESSGHLTFPVQAMGEVSGRLILGALDMLLGADRLFNVPVDRRLPKLLSDSREYQAEVSTQLADQVLDALWELLHGFQSADAATNGQMLRQVENREIYGGLITTLMRLVFLLYAEDQGLMPGDGVYQRNYAVTGLYERLREDDGNYPDTMDQRYGAWAWLLSLFRLVYDGGGATAEYLPARHGQLFDPDEYPFLEGRAQNTSYKDFEVIEAPRISDKVIHRLLEKLLVLSGERLSYRALDVEQIGSVYEGIMGFTVEQTQSPSIGVYSKPKGSKVSTTVVVDVAVLLETIPKDRAKLLKDWANCEISGKGLAALKAAMTIKDVVAALGQKVSRQTRNVLPEGSLYLQPTEERRRSGSHYTPRKLTQPIVETTLRPVLEGLGEQPTAEQILSLKVCDLAMGSGAFLVEVCRQLAEWVVEAWSRDGQLKNVPDDVDPLVAARRLVAQRCLYGVDINPFAVNLAKLSLWLVTLAKDRPFTFVDHALKCGDSLVGLTRDEIGSFGKDPTEDLPLMHLLKAKLDRVKVDRAAIQAMDTRTDAEAEKKLVWLRDAEQILAEARLTGDVKIAAFFDGNSVREQKEKVEEYAEVVRQWRRTGSAVALQGISERLRQGQHPVMPFNWEIEFPEVFDKENPGFDSIVGNPPFLGGKRVSTFLGDSYKNWLPVAHSESNNNADLVAHFFRRAFTLIRYKGTIGLIATNTIAQGDTRSSGLRFICENNGTIYSAQERVRWPGLAAVVVSVINIFKGNYLGNKVLNGCIVNQISAFLFHAGGHQDPKKLLTNSNKCFQGVIILGMGFTFDDSNSKVSSLLDMNSLIDKSPKSSEFIFPYIGGQEIYSSPIHAHHRYVINFGDMAEEEVRQWPDLMRIVEEKVKPERDGQKRDKYRTRWWQYAEPCPGLMEAKAQKKRVIATLCQAATHLSFAMMRPDIVFANSLAVITLENFSCFATLQSNAHSIWAWFFGSSMKDDLRYNPPDCFETFPFPENWETDPTLEAIGKTYYEYRADLMVRNNQGLTDTYNRFHNPEERDPDILKLRELHSQMDRAVLNAYGWEDISTDCEFILDYEEEDDESGSRRKKPWRYRWPEAVHDEVLARLLVLNQQRHEAEILGGQNATKKTKEKKANRKSKSAAHKDPEASQLQLLDNE